MASKMLLTDQAVARLKLATDGSYKVYDTEIVGFFVKVGTRQRTFMARGEFWRDGVREFESTTKVSTVEEITARDARKRAREIIGNIAKGQRPGETAKTRVGEVTLRQAWERYKDAHLVRKGRGERTIKGYQDHVDQHLADWLDRPLARLGRDPSLLAERHDRVTKAAGPYAANGCMRTLRAIYNHASKSHLNLPRNPVVAVDWNEEARRDTGMGEADLTAWFAQLWAIDNPIRREFHLLSLLSGSRPDALKKASLDHLDLRRRILHLPRPKGGAKKAFDIPLSRPMMRSIIRLIRASRMVHPEQAELWLFPADSAGGHLVEHKEDRDNLAKWGNELRQSYRTLAQPAGVSELDIHLLMNHSLPGVNAGYITRHRLLENHLREQQEKISQLIMQTVSAPKQKTSAEVTWLRSYRLNVESLETVTPERTIAA